MRKLAEKIYVCPTCGFEDVKPGVCPDCSAELEETCEECGNTLDDCVCEVRQDEEKEK